VPDTVPVNDTEVVLLPLHTDWLDTVATDGVGLTEIVKLVLEPEQPLADGVTVIVAVATVVPVFTAENEAMLPVPLAARPMEVLLLVQL